MSFEPDDTSRHFVIKLKKKQKQKEKEKMRIIESLVSPFWCFCSSFGCCCCCFSACRKGRLGPNPGLFFFLIKFPYLAQMVSH
jgi:hypothetical protein